MGRALGGARFKPNSVMTRCRKTNLSLLRNRCALLQRVRLRHNEVLHPWPRLAFVETRIPLRLRIGPRAQPLRRATGPTRSLGAIPGAFNAPLWKPSPRSGSPFWPVSQALTRPRKPHLRRSQSEPRSGNTDRHTDGESAYQASLARLNRAGPRPWPTSMSGYFKSKPKV